jgi:hypothetical protein
MFIPQMPAVYAEEAAEEEGEEEYVDEEGGDEEEYVEDSSEEGGEDEEYFEEDEEFSDEESFDEGMDGEAFLDEVFDEGGGEGDEFADPTQSAIDNVLDLLERHQGIQLLPEQFIYPFSPEHQPMLANNLVASVQGDGPSGFQSKSIKKDKKKKKRTMGSKNAHGVGRIISLGADGAPSSGGSGAVRTGSGGKGGSTKSATLPDFEITGKFGTKDKEYIVIGNRYYTLEQRLKGSRALRKVRLIGIDDTMAYFDYNNTTFPKKIKALERIF